VIAPVDVTLFASALIRWSISNEGRVMGGNYGIRFPFVASGVVTNGSAIDHTALVSGAKYGIGGQTGSYVTITNYATITTTHSGSGYGYGVALGGYGGYITNQGRIGGGSGGVALSGSSSFLRNGSDSGGRASIVGQKYGVLLEGNNSTLANFGSIVGISGTGLRVAFPSGTIANGSRHDGTASISGRRFGISIFDAHMPIANYGTISGTGRPVSAHMQAYLDRLRRW
jgi:hypothetical protein